MKFNTALIVVAMALALAGCNRSASNLRPDTRSEPAPLPSTPVEPVKKAELPEPTPAEEPKPEELEAPVAPETPGESEQEVASLEQPAPSKPEPITREGMTGTWNVATDNPDCRVILAFTKWSGGYRAASRRCTSSEIATVTAWDVKGQQVVLVDANGNTVARLYSSGGTRYDGTTNSGKAISFSR